jgi:tetratricopeptide (TPR) repeat protein
MLVGGAAALVVAALATSRAVLRSPAPSAAIDAPPSASASAPGPERVTYADIPVSPTDNPAALKAFRDAMLDMRDGDDDAWGKALEEAVRLDPEFASARLHRGLRVKLYGALNGDTSEARDDYLHAVRARGAFGPRDRALLDALEPLFNAVPADLAATEAKLAALAGTSADAQIWDMVGRVRRWRDHLEPAAEAYARESEIDPQSARALERRGAILESIGDLAGARASYERCFRAQPRAATCRSSLTALLDEMGDCEAYVQRAREYAALAPSDPDAVVGKIYADGSAGVPRSV